jgi:excisionase family DNA binding protein
MVAAASQQLEQIRRMHPVAATPDQQRAFAALSQLLEQVGSGRKKPKCELLGPAGQRIELPEAGFYVLERVAEVLARGDAITVVPVGKELTTQQAADLLNVSRQYLVRLLDEGKLPYTKTGAHRRLRIEHVLAYRNVRDQERRAKLRELTTLSEELGGYTEFD